MPSKRASVAPSYRSIRQYCIPYSRRPSAPVFVSACRRQISDSTLCVKITAGHGSRFGRFTAGSSRSDFSHRMRMGKRLNSFVVDERAVPQFEVDEAPEAIAAVGGAGRVRAQQRVDGVRLEKPALARAAIEQDLARDAVPRAAR